MEKRITERELYGSVRSSLEYSLKEAVYNLLSWVKDKDEDSVDNLMAEMYYLFVHSTTDPNVQS